MPSQRCRPRAPTQWTRYPVRRIRGGFILASLVALNYFGAVELAEGLRGLLTIGTAPRIAIVSSSASILPFDERIVEFLAGDELGARAAATCRSPEEIAARSGPIYAASKRALSRWIRRTAPLPEWAGAAILLNGVAPGLVKTPMTAPLLETEQGRAILTKGGAPRRARRRRSAGHRRGVCLSREPGKSLHGRTGAVL